MTYISYWLLVEFLSEALNNAPKFNHESAPIRIKMSGTSKKDLSGLMCIGTVFGILLRFVFTPSRVSQYRVPTLRDLRYLRVSA